MTKVLRMLAGGGFAAVLGMVLLGLSGAFSASTVEAQSPPARPARFVGSVTVDGAPAASGATVVALVNGAECGTATVFIASGEARYSIDVAAADPSGNPNCGTDGATVSFTVSGAAAPQTGVWHDYQLNTVNLAITTSTATPTATATATTTATTTATATATGTATGTATATRTGTPAAPRTGSGVDNSGSNAPLFAGLGIAAIALGAAGAAAARRSR